MFSIILRDNGIDRTFTAQTYFDAQVLFSALTNRYTHIEMWQGATLLDRYDNT